MDTVWAPLSNNQEVIRVRDLLGEYLAVGTDTGSRMMGSNLSASHKKFSQLNSGHLLGRHHLVAMDSRTFVGQIIWQRVRSYSATSFDDPLLWSWHRTQDSPEAVSSAVNQPDESFGKFSKSSSEAKTKKIVHASLATKTFNESLIN